MRAKTPEDEAFLFNVYASTRAFEMSTTGWPPYQCQEFLQGQFNAQIRSYEADYPKARFDVVLVDGERCGRLYVDRGADEIRILDLSMAPQFCGQGIGTKIVEGLCQEAKESERSLTTYVHKHDVRGIAFYTRFGFRQELEIEFSVMLAWRAPRIVV
ncbi:MAG: GNAT family N-acetyltransferase [Verrucomicrobiales bacterium]|nr:GNAT family N-acetyltransferase [Verrucomicrobiales bacterium]